MEIYHLSQKINTGYDTFDSIVVCAESEMEARLIHPITKDWCGKEESCFPVWVDADLLTVKHIGKAKEGIEKGIICASFNAG